MKVNFGKTLKYVSATCGGAIGASGITLIMPRIALANESGGTTQTDSGGDPWSPKSLITETSTGGIKPADVNQNNAETLVKNIASWALGIAIALFVLKVVLTAVDRLFVGGEMPQQGRPMPGKGSFLQMIPIVGAYPPPDGHGNGYSWKEVFINFMVQIAICTAAWLIVQFLIGMILWFFGQIQPSSGASDAQS